MYIALVEKGKQQNKQLVMNLTKLLCADNVMTHDSAASLLCYCYTDTTKCTMTIARAYESQSLLHYALQW